MVYLLDENVLINVARDIYPADRFPEFWAWLLHHIEDGSIRTLKPISKKLKEKRPEDMLARWVRKHESKMLVDTPPAVLVRRVLTEGYGQRLRPTHLEQIENDVLLIAAALAAPNTRTVVTMESADRRSRKGLKRHIPHVCGLMKVEWATPFDLLKQLDFRTSAWR